MGRSTLHRYPHLCNEIRQISSLAEGHAAVRTTRSGSRSLTNTIKDLRVQIKDLKTQLAQSQEQKIELLVELDKVQRQRPKVVPLKA